MQASQAQSYLFVIVLVKLCTYVSNIKIRCENTNLILTYSNKALCSVTNTALKNPSTDQITF